MRKSDTSYNAFINITYWRNLMGATKFSVEVFVKRVVINKLCILL